MTSPVETEENNVTFVHAPKLLVKPLLLLAMLLDAIFRRPLTQRSRPQERG
jgi:hypothetical protein